MLLTPLLAMLFVQVILVLQRFIKSILMSSLQVQNIKRLRPPLRNLRYVSYPSFIRQRSSRKPVQAMYPVMDISLRVGTRRSFDRHSTCAYFNSQVRHNAHMRHFVSIFVIDR